MKLLVWNVGLYSRMKWAPYLWLKVKWVALEHELFTKWNLWVIEEVVNNQMPDVVCVLEIPTPEDAELLQTCLGYEYCYSFEGIHQKHLRVVLSHTPREEHRVTVDWEELFVLKSDYCEFIPVHLNSREATSRFSQANNLCSYLKMRGANEKRLIIAWDTNLYHYRDYFLFEKDKKSYKLFAEHGLHDFGASYGTTTPHGGKFDKIFGTLLPNAFEVIRKKGIYMDHYPLVCEI
jgi:exonuclease III